MLFRSVPARTINPATPKAKIPEYVCEVSGAVAGDQEYPGLRRANGADCLYRLAEQGSIPPHCDDHAEGDTDPRFKDGGDLGVSGGPEDGECRPS